MTGCLALQFDLAVFQCFRIALPTRKITEVLDYSNDIKDISSLCGFNSMFVAFTAFICCKHKSLFSNVTTLHTVEMNGCSEDEFGWIFFGFILIVRVLKLYSS